MMAPVYDFRHVEIDKIGRGKRVTRPPGGECSDIFGTTPSDFADHCSTKMNGCSVSSSPARARRHSTDTQNRLFGPPETMITPRRAPVDRMKSNIFDMTDGAQMNHHSAKKATPAARRNPITGEFKADKPSTPTNGHLNGHTNGTHGTNGDAPMNGISNGEAHTPTRSRPPPGGKSSGIF